MPLAVLGCGPDDAGAGNAADAGRFGNEAGPSGADQGTADTAAPYPDIVAAELVPAGDGVFDVKVTVSSEYDTAERYADGWRVLAPDGTVLGEHQLLHDHASEQPFTRTQRGLSVPDGIDVVTVEGRDLVNGYGGASLTVAVPRPIA
jgi:hypothetical protein